MKKSTRFLALILVLSMLSLVVGGCAAPAAPAAPAAAPAAPAAPVAPEAAPAEAAADELEPIVLACSMPLSGSMAESGVGAQQGIIHAVDEWNDKGGVKLDDGMHRIELLMEDDGGAPDVALANFEKFINHDDAKLLYGIVLSGSALAAMELLKKYDVFMSTVRCTSTEISEKVESDPEAYKNFWRPEYVSRDLGVNIADAVYSMGEAGDFDFSNKTVAYIAEDNDYGRSTVDGCQVAFEAMGATTVAYELVPEGTVDFYSQLNKIKQADPDVVICLLMPVSSGVAYCKQYIEVGLDALQFSIGYPEEAGFYEQVGAAGEGLVWSIMRSDFVNNPKHIEYADNFEARYGFRPVYDQMHTYDTTNMLLEAIERAGVYDADKISEEYGKSDYQGYIGRIMLAESDHSMISGPEHYPHSVAQIQDGASQVIWPDYMATTEFRPQ